ncbi:hypothetical protein BLOT_013738 [Blomia tropicalis]|nr:hypothetical protein BLOT_013738 [Blomia tropicalis]
MATILCSTETKPIETISDLLKWSENISVNNDDQTAQYYQIPKLVERDRSTLSDYEPLTLLCHDMKGGYLEDRFNDGHTNSDSYRFYYWSLIDIFCYFSHQFVTIPPINWTIAAHRNGVRCFGTIIVEDFTKYEENHSTNSYRMILDLLKDEQQLENLTNALTNIAKYYQFDGWLINIETEIPKEKIVLMVSFLRLLRSKMKEMLNINHDDITVLWYDSVTCDNGKLEWQNELNERNLQFFNACDGIFLNYCWKVKNLEQCQNIVDRKLWNRIFVGVDVFGRGCIGGGGFNTNIAIEEIYKKQLSMALFAPGWTHEKLGQHDFPSNEYKFWSKLTPYLSEQRISLELPIQTSFCQGFGKQLWENGKLCSPKSWYNLGRQELQPCFGDTLVTTDVAFNGGSCLKLLNTRTKLFHCSILVRKKNIVLKIIYKSNLPNDQILDLINPIIEFSSNNDTELYEIDSQKHKKTNFQVETHVDKLFNSWICKTVDFKFNLIENFIIKAIWVEISEENFGTYIGKLSLE